jgi:hypothetical protein
MSEEVKSLYDEPTPEGGVIRLAKWPEGYVLWHHGEIVWRSWQKEAAPEWTQFAIAKLELKPGDIVVLKSADRISLETSLRLCDRFRTLVPNHNKVVVLERIDIAVVRPTEGNAA